MNQAERKFALSIVVQGGHGPFRGLDAPFRARRQRNSERRPEVNRGPQQSGAEHCHMLKPQG